MADDERPSGGKNDKRWLYGGLAAGGLAFVYVWWKNRGGSSSASSGSPTDLRDIIQVNYAKPPADTEDNQPTVHHKPKPKPKPKRKPKPPVRHKRKAA